MLSEKQPYPPHMHHRSAYISEKFNKLLKIPGDFPALCRRPPLFQKRPPGSKETQLHVHTCGLRI